MSKKPSKKPHNTHKQTVNQGKSLAPLPSNPKVVVFSMILRWDQYVPRAIDSVTQQSYKNWEYFIYSSEASHSHIEEYTKNYPNIHVMSGYKFSPEGDRYTDAFLHVASHGDLFCTMDGDDQMASTFMEMEINHIIAHNLDLCTCSIGFHDVNGKDVSEVDGFRYKRSYEENFAIKRPDFLENYTLIQSCFTTLWARLSRTELFSAELFQDIPNYVISIDLLIGRSLMKVARSVGAIKEIGYYYTINPEGEAKTFAQGRETTPHLTHLSFESSIKTWVTKNCPKERQQLMNDIVADTHVNFIPFTLIPLFFSDRDIQEKLTMASVPLLEPETKQFYSMPRYEVNGMDLFGNIQRSLNQGGLSFTEENLALLYQIADSLCARYMKKITRDEFESIILRKMSFKVYCKKI